MPSKSDWSNQNIAVLHVSMQSRKRSSSRKLKHQLWPQGGDPRKDCWSMRKKMKCMQTQWKKYWDHRLKNIDTTFVGNAVTVDACCTDIILCTRVKHRDILHCMMNWTCWSCAIHATTGHTRTRKLSKQNEFWKDDCMIYSQKSWRTSIYSFIFFLTYTYDWIRKNEYLWRKSRMIIFQSIMRRKSEKSERVVRTDYWPLCWFENGSMTRRKRKTAVGSNHWSTDSTDASSEVNHLGRLVLYFCKYAHDRGKNQTWW